MDLGTAFKKSVQAYFRGITMDGMNKSLETPLKYNKDYFDRIEEEFGLSDRKSKDEKDLEKKSKEKR